MFAPQCLQCLVSKIRQWHQAVFVAFASPNMDQIALTINVTDLQRQRFAEPQPHGVRGQQEDAVAELARCANQVLDFTGGENVRQRPHLRGFNDLDPGPVFLQDVPPDTLQAITVDLDGTSGM